MRKIKGLLIKPYKNPIVINVEDSLASLQGLVGGYIQVTKPAIHDDDAVVICNEEGKLLDLPLNRPLLKDDGVAYDVIRGDFLIMSAPPHSEDFKSLTEEQIYKYSRLYEI